LKQQGYPHLHPDRPYHRRRNSQLRHAGGPEYRRTEGVIGFAGPRVIVQQSAKTAGRVPAAEYLLEHA
jgi:hypothetical protein